MICRKVDRDTSDQNPVRTFLAMSGRVLVLFLTTSILFATGCAPKTVDTENYLGDYSYDAPLTAMVYENFEGEGMGIVYREVVDYDKLIGYAKVPVVLYFYSPIQQDGGEATAIVEQLAENYHDRLLIVSIDTMQSPEKASHFDIEAVPDFVILSKGTLLDSFHNFDGKAWTESDLETWILEVSGVDS